MSAIHLVDNQQQCEQQTSGEMLACMCQSLFLATRKQRPSLFAPASLVLWWYGLYFAAEKSVRYLSAFASCCVAKVFVDGPRHPFSCFLPAASCFAQGRQRTEPLGASPHEHWLGQIGQDQHQHHCNDEGSDWLGQNIQWEELHKKTQQVGRDQSQQRELPLGRPGGTRPSRFGRSFETRTISAPSPLPPFVGEANTFSALGNHGCHDRTVPSLS